MTSKQAREWVDSCLNEGRHLTKWEEQFLYAMDEKITLGQTLTSREVEILEQIFQERVR